MSTVCLSDAIRPSDRSPRVSGRELLTAVLDEPLAVEYQPLKHARSLDTVAYEALARFAVDGRPLAPGPVFAALHDNPLLLHYVELKCKRLQIERAPQRARLFVNLDPDAWLHGLRCDRADRYLELFSQHADRVVVEIVENLHLRDVELAERIGRSFRSAGITLALDDVSSSQGLLSCASLLSARYMKFDRHWLNGDGGDEDSLRVALLESVLLFARRAGLTTILEGVETQAHLALARHLGFDWVQGFLFGDQCIRREAAPCARAQPPRRLESAQAVVA
jgi:EAL domain-containing protein (putative c-di-GMP-specific phosphodiesterase class I)